MHAERSNVGTRFARDPEDGKMALVVEFNELGLVDCSNTELTFYGRDQGRSLEESASQCFEGTREGLFVGECVVKAEYADVFFSCTLLGFDQTCCSIDTDCQAASDFWIECSRVTGLFATQYTANPSDYFVRGRV